MKYSYVAKLRFSLVSQHNNVGGHKTWRNIVKKLLKITALIAATALACAFFGCSNGSSSDDNTTKSSSSTGSSGTNNSNNSTTNTSGSSNSFDDCTTTVAEVTLADGSWTIQTVSNDENKGNYNEYNIKATQSGDTLTYNSGSRKNITDLSKVMSAEQLAAFNKLSEAEKKNKAVKGMGLSNDATITFTETTCTATGELSADALNEYKTKLSGFIKSANEIKTNTDKTKYAITRNFDKEAPLKIYISKN